MPFILSNEQMHFVFNNQFDNIKNLLDHRRKEAASYKNNTGSDSSREHNNPVYDQINESNGEKYMGVSNVISILGNRGAGKTSMLFTIMDKLKKDCIGDHFVPVIIPEMITASSEILGLILGYLKKIVDELTSPGENSWCAEESNGSKLKNVYDDIINDYGKITSEFRKNLEVRQTTVVDFIRMKQDSLSFELNIRDRLIKFWDRLIAELQKRNKKGHHKDPFIFFFFDDIDLSPERCEEVLSTIYRYLKHPNIVVFVAACYDTLVEALTISYLKKDNLLYQDLLRQDYVNGNSPENTEAFNNALFTKNRLAKECILKVLPSHSRYNISKIQNNRKLDFIFSDKQNSSGSTETINSLIASKLPGLKKTLQYDDNNSKQLDLVLSAFPDSVRGLYNIAHYLFHLEKNKLTKEGSISNEEKCEEKRDEILHIFHLFNHSSNILSKYTADIQKLISFSNIPPQINYKVLWDKYETKISRIPSDAAGPKAAERKIELYNDFITLFCFAFMMDSIIEQVFFPYLFYIKDVNEKFLVSLQSEERDNVQQYIFESIFKDDKYGFLLTKWDKEKFIEAINTRILCDSKFTTKVKETFGEVKEIAKLLKKSVNNPDDTDIWKINLHILEILYPYQFSICKKDANEGNDMLYSIINSIAIEEQLPFICPKFDDIKDTLMFAQLFLDRGLEKMIIYKEDSDFVTDVYFNFLNDFSSIYFYKHFAESKNTLNENMIYYLFSDMYLKNDTWIRPLLILLIKQAKEYKAFQKVIEKIQEFRGEFLYAPFPENYMLFGDICKAQDKISFCAQKINEIKESLNNVSADSEDQKNSFLLDIANLLAKDKRTIHPYPNLLPVAFSILSMASDWIYGNILHHYNKAEYLHVKDNDEFEKFLVDINEVEDLNLFLSIKALAPDKNGNITMLKLQSVLIQIRNYVNKAYKNDSFHVIYVSSFVANLIRLFEPMFKNEKDNDLLKEMFDLLEFILKCYAYSTIYIELSDYQDQNADILLRKCRDAITEINFIGNNDDELLTLKKYSLFNNFFNLIYQSSFEELFYA